MRHFRRALLDLRVEFVREGARESRGNRLARLRGGTCLDRPDGAGPQDDLAP